MGVGVALVSLPMSFTDVLTIAPAALVIAGVAPLLGAHHSAKINLSVWAVITANAWLAGVGNLFSEQTGASAFYMIANAVILTPVLFLNLKKGVWGDLPTWHKLAAPLLPLGTLIGLTYGGEFSTWASVVISVFLTIQLVESTWKGLAREHLTTWSFFLVSDGSALFFGWAESNYALRCLLGVWVVQCAAVMLIELLNWHKNATQSVGRTTHVWRAHHPSPGFCKVLKTGQTKSPVVMVTGGSGFPNL